MAVSDITPAFSAGAASVAAFLAGINLYYSARKDRLGWARSALESAFVDFLTASYSHREACREIARLQQGESSRLDETGWRAMADTAHDVMMRCATRFRMLASDETAEIALAVHEHNDGDIDLINEGRAVEFLATRCDRAVSFHHDRDRFVDEAQRVLGV